MPHGLPGIRHRLMVAANAYRRFTARFVPAIRLGSVIVGVAAFIGAIACLTALTIYFGFIESRKRNVQLSKTKRAKLLFFRFLFLLLFRPLKDQLNAD